MGLTDKIKLYSISLLSTVALTSACNDSNNSSQNTPIPEHAYKIASDVSCNANYFHQRFPSQMNDSKTLIIPAKTLELTSIDSMHYLPSKINLTQGSYDLQIRCLDYLENLSAYVDSNNNVEVERK